MICKCLVFCSLSFMIVVIKLAGIKAKAIEIKKTKLLLFLVSPWFFIVKVRGKGAFAN